MLTDRIRIKDENCTEPEDIFLSALTVIFPDDVINHHGESARNVIYDSALYGEIEISLADPKSEDVYLYSHFLWNAAVQLVALMEAKEEKGASRDTPWDVRGLRVLELGAGSGLVGIMACLMGAKSTVISDYPAAELLANIQVNITRNLISRPSLPKIDGPPVISVQAHKWGLLNDSFALSHQAAFDRILVCDCLWMSDQHENLQLSITWFLAPGGRAWVVSGFHTGRAVMAGFFEENSLHRANLEVEKIWERCVDGTDREWLVDRGQENITERKRWLAIAVLRKIR